MPGTLVSLDQFAAHPYQRPPPFVCTAEDSYVYVRGEIDVATTPQLERALAEALSRSLAVVLDLQDVTFLDSRGTRAIVMASVLAQARGRRLVLLHGPPNVDRLFDLTGNADHVVFFEPTHPYAAALGGNAHAHHRPDRPCDPAADRRRRLQPPRTPRRLAPAF